MCDIPYSLDTDIVERFHTLHEWSDRALGELSDLKHRLELRLSVDELVLCAGLYMRRDPSVGELRFVDALLAMRRHDPTLANVAAFQTKDRALANAFSHVLAHCRGALPQQPPTLTLCDAWEALGDHATGKAQSYPRLTTLPHMVARALQGQRPTDAVRIEGTPWYVAQTIPTVPYRPRSLKKGDLCSLIQLPPNADFQAMRPLIGLLSEKKQQRRILRLCAVTKTDLVPTLLSLAEGWQVDLSSIEGLFDEPPHVAIDHLPTGILMCADEKNTRKLCDDIRALGFSISAFARISADRHLTLTTHGKTEFAFESLHLRLLLTPQPISLTLPRSADPTRLSEATVNISTALLGNHALHLCTLSLASPLNPEDLDTLVRQLQKAAALPLSGQPPHLCVGLVVGNTAKPSALWATTLGLLRYRDEHRADIVSFAYTFDPNAAEDRLTLCLITPKQETFVNEEQDNSTREVASDAENV
ncbi:MAG: hypothetical protein E7625_00475 [Ruminococcaceae bacterium]|nr:hypothetical protein [Oscillospiraceae bacterium]